MTRSCPYGRAPTPTVGHASPLPKYPAARGGSLSCHSQGRIRGIPLQPSGPAAGSRSLRERLVSLSASLSRAASPSYGPVGGGREKCPPPSRRLFDLGRVVEWIAHQQPRHLLGFGRFAGKRLPRAHVVFGHVRSVSELGRGAGRAVDKYGCARRDRLGGRVFLRGRRI